MKVTVSESKGLKTNLNVLVKKQEIDKKIEEIELLNCRRLLTLKVFDQEKRQLIY